jgi:hypothetical protein
MLKAPFEFTCVPTIKSLKWVKTGINWLISTPSYWFQRVLINNSSSSNTNFAEWGKIKHGVPQGSILGPLFFSNLYRWSSNGNSWPIETGSIYRWHKHGYYKS